MIFQWLRLGLLFFHAEFARVFHAIFGDCQWVFINDISTLWPCNSIGFPLEMNYFCWAFFFGPEHFPPKIGWWHAASMTKKGRCTKELVIEPAILAEIKLRACNSKPFTAWTAQPGFCADHHGWAEEPPPGSPTWLSCYLIRAFYIFWVVRISIINKTYIYIDRVVSEKFVKIPELLRIFVRSLVKRMAANSSTSIQIQFFSIISFFGVFLHAQKHNNRSWFLFSLPAGVKLPQPTPTFWFYISPKTNITMEQNDHLTMYSYFLFKAHDFP